MSDNKAEFTEGNIAKLIFFRTLPMIIGMVGMLSFNLIDTYFVGQISTAALAAISYTFPITFIVTSVALGIGAGASAVVSREIGSGNSKRTIRLASDSLTLGLIFVLIFILAGIFTIDPLFGLLGAEGEVLQLVRDYMIIWYPGTLFVVIPMIGNSLLRAKGDMKTPSFVMLVAVIVNTILDWLLIFGIGPFPELGIKGAAIATVVARAITLFVSLHFLYRRDKIISFKIPKLRDVKYSYKSILYIGLPSAGTMLIMPIGISVIISIISVYGPEAVAGFGVAARIEAFALTVIMALGSVLGPFIGQNSGAKLYDRVDKGIQLSQGFSMIWGLIIFILMLLFAENLGSMFNDNPDVILVIKNYLWIVPISYGFQSIVMITGVAFNVLQKPFIAAFLALLKMAVLYVPLAFLGSYLMGLNGVFIAAVIANVIVGIIGYIWLMRFTARLKHES